MSDQHFFPWTGLRNIAVNRCIDLSLGRNEIYKQIITGIHANFLEGEILGRKELSCGVDGSGEVKMVHRGLCTQGLGTKHAVGRAFESGFDLLFQEFPDSALPFAIGKHKCTQVYPQVQTGPGTPTPMEEPERSLQVLKAGLQRDSRSGTLGWYIPQTACLQVEPSSVKSRCETVCLIGESISHHLRWLLLRMREESLPKIRSFNLMCFAGTICRPGIHQGQQKASDPLEIELRTAVSCCMGAGSQNPVLWKRSQYS